MSTHCFDSKTAGFAAKALELYPRDLTHERMEYLEKSGALREIFSMLSREDDDLQELLGVIRHELDVQKPENPWVKKGDVTYFYVDSIGLSGKQWIDLWEGKVSSRAQELLLSNDFVPTDGRRYRIAVVPGEESTAGDEIDPQERVIAGKKQPYYKANLELACLIAHKFTEDNFEAMGYSNGIVFIQKPVGLKFRLIARSSALSACQANRRRSWCKHYAFCIG